MKEYKYIIVAPSYTETSGGIMALHKFCDLLIKRNINVVICPFDIHYPYSFSPHLKNRVLNLLFHPIKTLKNIRRYIINLKKFEINNLWITPIIRPLTLFLNPGLKNYIVIYPEIINDNPLGAKNIVRWLMNDPGFFTGKINYGQGELYFRYSDSFARDFRASENSKISKYFLKISTTPDCFYSTNTQIKRKGTAYCIRKGAGKDIIHDINDSILIDDLPLNEVAEIFRRVEKFISYDPITALSYFALLCDCPSYIILDKDESSMKYRPNNYKYYAYSLNENIDWNSSFEWAKMLDKIKSKENQDSIDNFLKETKNFFSL